MNYILLLAWLIACAFQDAQQRRVANALILGGLSVALLHLIALSSSLTGAAPAAALLGMAVACLLSLPGYLSGRMGAADVKMLVTLGAASESMHVLLSVIGAAVAHCLWFCLAKRYPHILLHLPERFVFLRPFVIGNPSYAPFLCVGFAITALWAIAG